jgi:hypothetical protein
LSKFGLSVKELMSYELSSRSLLEGIQSLTSNC